MFESTVASGVLILIVALVLDLFGIGPSDFRDRIALVLAANGAYALWANTDAVDNVANALRNGIKSALVAAGAQPGPNDAGIVVTALVSVLAFIAILGLWSDTHPDDDTAPDGRRRSGGLRMLASKVTLRCADDRRLNPRVWFIGVPLGALAPLAGGLIGTGLQLALGFMPGLIAGGINLLFVGAPS